MTQPRPWPNNAREARRVALLKLSIISELSLRILKEPMTKDELFRTAGMIYGEALKATLELERIDLGKE